MVARIKRDFENSLFHVFSNADELEIQALGEPQTLDGVSYRVGFVHSEAVRDWLIFFDGDGRIARMEFQGEGPAGPAKQTVIYGDWQKVGGIEFPHQQKVLLDDKPYLETKVMKLEINPELAADLFIKPAS